MKCLLIAALLASLPSLAHAQTSIYPTTTHGCGTMPVTTTSAYVNSGTVALCPGTASFPTGNMSSLTVNNQANSANGIMFCPTGGPCASVGMYLPVGQGVTKAIPFVTVPPALVTISGTATAYLEW